MERTNVDLDRKTDLELIRNARRTLQKIRSTLSNHSFYLHVEIYRRFEWFEESESHSLGNKLSISLGIDQIQHVVGGMECGVEKSVRRLSRRDLLQQLR